MKSHNTRLSPRLGWRAMLGPAALVLMVGTGGSAQAGGTASKSTAAEAQNYQRERAACLDGSSSQDRTTCLKEAAAARAEARRGTLDNGERADQLRANALKRCAAVAAGDRDDCERLALGEGQRSGSVAEGAVVKTIVTRTVGPVPAASGAAAASR